PGRGADSPRNEPHASITQSAVQTAGMPRLGSVRVTVVREIRLHLEHPGRRKPANRPLVRAQVYSRSPNAVGVSPEAAPQNRRVAEVSTGAVHFREKDGVRQAVGNGGERALAVDDAVDRVAEDVVIAGVVADAPVVGAAIVGGP